VWAGLRNIEAKAKGVVADSFCFRFEIKSIGFDSRKAGVGLPKTRPPVPKAGRGVKSSAAEAFQAAADSF
jgi:hypothetical protein